MVKFQKEPVRHLFISAERVPGTQEIRGPVPGGGGLIYVVDFCVLSCYV